MQAGRVTLILTISLVCLLFRGDHAVDFEWVALLAGWLSCFGIELVEDCLAAARVLDPKDWLLGGAKGLLSDLIVSDSFAYEVDKGLSKLWV